jgi:hypothetical protein
MRRQPQPSHRNVIHLRLPEDLHAQIQRAADQHHVSATAEVRTRLLASFEDDRRRGLERITTDLQVCWARFSARFLRLQLDEELVAELAGAQDPEKIKTLARLWLEHRTIEQRQVVS